MTISPLRQQHLLSATKALAAARPEGAKNTPAAVVPATKENSAVAQAKEGVSQLKLSNGTTVILNSDPDSEVVDIAIAVKAGALQDFKGKEGGAHLIEHMFFGGTPTRPGDQITKEMDAQGGQGNASTSLSKITFTTTVPNSEARNALSLFTDIFTHPNSDPAKLEREKMIVEQELRQRLTPDAQASYEFQRLMLGDQPLTRSPGGTVKTVRAVQPKDITAFSNKYFTGNNTVVVISGAPSAFDTKILEDTIGKLPAGTAVDNTKLFQGYRKGALVEVVPDEQRQQTSLLISFPGMTNEAKLRPAAEVLSTLMGGGLSSRLNARLREKDQITYGVSAGHLATAEYGKFIVNTSISNENLRFGVAEIADELKNAAATITDAEVERAKRQTVNSLTMSLADSNEEMDGALAMAINGKVSITTRQLREAVGKVTTAQVQQAARELFDFEQIKMLAVGNLKDTALLHGGIADAGIKTKLTDVAFDRERYLATVAG